MKVLLIQPPISDFYDTKIRTYPLGLLYLGAKIKDIVDVTLLDLRTGFKPKIIREPFFEDLNEFYKDNKISPFSFFKSFYYFGIDKTKIKQKIKEIKPDIICISSLFSTYFYDLLDAVREIKKANKDILIVVGGNHPTIYTHDTLSYKEIDFVIRGEGETPLYNLVKSIKEGSSIKGIRGLSYREGDNVVISSVNVEETIDLVPYRDLLDSKRYKIGKKNYAFMITTRGCPKRCSFCGKPEAPFRKINIETIKSDLENCLSLGVEIIDFEDDMLTLDRDHFEDVLNIFYRKNLLLTAMNGIYAENLDEELLKKMYLAGFRRLNISLVDISKEILSSHNRFKANFTKLLAFLENSDFNTEIHFIIGLPKQRVEDVINTMLFLMEHRCLPAPSIFYLAPGSKIFNDYKEIDRFDIRAFRSSYMIEIDENFNRRNIYTLLLLVRFINLVKAYIDKNPYIKKLSDVLDLLDGMERQIFKHFLEEKFFYYFDRDSGFLTKEPVEKDLIELFFKKAKNRFIKGFKSLNKIVFDI